MIVGGGEMVIGFTGTRNGMTREQWNAVGILLCELPPGPGLHGSCVGADDDFDTLCRANGRKTLCRPCVAPAELVAQTTAKPIAELERPIARNRAIVADAGVMIACPPNRIPIRSGSGIWATIGFADRAKKPLFIVYPEGDVDERRTGGVWVQVDGAES